jgi:hypothetical protein
MALYLYDGVVGSHRGLFVVVSVFCRPPEMYPGGHTVVLLCFVSTTTSIVRNLFCDSKCGCYTRRWLKMDLPCCYVTA